MLSASMQRNSGQDNLASHMDTTDMNTQIFTVLLSGLPTLLLDTLDKTELLQRPLIQRP